MNETYIGSFHLRTEPLSTFMKSSPQATELTHLPFPASHPSPIRPRHVFKTQIGRTRNEGVSATNATRQSLQSQFTQPSSQLWLTRPVNYNYYNMAEVKKQEKDYTKEVDEILPEARSLADVSAFGTMLCSVDLIALWV